MLVRTGAKAEELGYRAIQTAEGIRIVPFLLELHLVIARMPASATAEIARVVEREHGGLFKRRCIKGRSGVRLVMLHHDDLGFWKLIAQSDVEQRLRPASEGARQGNAIDILARGSSQAQAFVDRCVRHGAGVHTARQLGFFDGRLKLSVFKERTRRVAEETA